MSANGLYLYAEEGLNGTYIDVTSSIDSVNNGNGQVTNSISVMSGAWNIYSSPGFNGQLNTSKLTTNGGPNCDGVYNTPADWGGNIGDVVQSVYC